MTEPAIKYRLIKKRKAHWGTFRGNHYTSWDLSYTDVHACWNASICEILSS